MLEVTNNLEGRLLFPGTLLARCACKETKVIDGHPSNTTMENNLFSLTHPLPVGIKLHARRVLVTKADSLGLGLSAIILF